MCNSHIPINCIKASLNVVSLVTSIPINIACDVICEVYPSSSLLPEIQLNTIIHLTSFCLSSNCFKFIDKLFIQIQRTSIGFPISAQIVMQFIERKIDAILKENIFFWKRYVDDIFIKTTQNYIDEILDTANNLYPSIQFTIKIEMNNKLPFLNIILNS